MLALLGYRVKCAGKRAEEGPVNFVRTKGIAVWHQIAAALREEIRMKMYALEGRLPAEKELASRFAVNRHTVRRAIAELEEQGLVRVEQGRGTFVVAGVVDYSLGKRTRFSENLRRLNKEPSREILQMLREPSTAQIARALGLSIGSQVLRIDTRNRADGQVISITAHYFSQRRFPDLMEVFEETKSVTKAFTRLGVTDYLRQRTSITARLPDAQEARLLEIPKNQPVLVAEAINVDAGGKPLEYGISRYAANRLQFVIDS
jgi:GntR family phosphonate transport system transcriptional regulator